MVRYNRSPAMCAVDNGAVWCRRPSWQPFLETRQGCPVQLPAKESGNRMNVLSDVRNVVASSLQLGARAERMDASTPLLGALPELDSMAVISGASFVTSDCCCSR